MCLQNSYFSMKLFCNATLITIPKTNTNLIGWQNLNLEFKKVYLLYSQIIVF